MRTNLIKNKIETEIKEQKNEVSDSKLDMVIAFDTTGSMSNYIDAVKKHVRELISKLLDSNPDLRIGIVAFGDYCDATSANDLGIAYQCIYPTNEKELLIDFVVSSKRTSGGDYNEFYELVIKKITEETPWREDAKKSVLLIADATPHSIGYNYPGMVKNNQIDWKEAARKAAAKGVKFDTVTISPHIWFKELSEITNGISVPFSNSYKTAQLMEAAAYARGGGKTRALYKKQVEAVKDDIELSMVYEAYSKEVIG